MCGRRAPREVECPNQQSFEHKPEEPGDIGLHVRKRYVHPNIYSGEQGPQYSPAPVPESAPLAPRGEWAMSLPRDVRAGSGTGHPAESEILDGIWPEAGQQKPQTGLPQLHTAKESFSCFSLPVICGRWPGARIGQGRTETPSRKGLLGIRSSGPEQRHLRCVEGAISGGAGGSFEVAPAFVWTFRYSV